MLVNTRTFAQFNKQLGVPKEQHMHREKRNVLKFTVTTEILRYFLQA